MPVKAAEKAEMPFSTEPEDWAGLIDPENVPPHLQTLLRMFAMDCAVRMHGMGDTLDTYCARADEVLSYLLKGTKPKY